MAEGALLALRHALYVPGWLLVGNLGRAAIAAPATQTYNFTKIALAFDGEAPVGVALVTSWMQVMVFCRKKYRRQGIGTNLITHLNVDKSVVTAGEGVSGTMNFWTANEIKNVSRRV